MAGPLGLLMVLVGALAVAGPAVSETNFPVIGGPGNGSFEDRCPAQQYLVAIQGRAGDWIDQLQLVCAQVWLAPRDGSIRGRYLVDHAEDWYLGPVRGGAGGGPTGGGCGGNPITGLQVAMTEGNRQVKYVAISCVALDGGATSGRFTGSVSPNYDVNTGSDRPSFQGCPSGEVGVGLRGRYGQAVNALALICGAFITPPPPYAVLHPGSPNPPPTPSAAAMTIKHTGRPKLSSPPPDAAPPPVPDAPAAPRVLTPGPFFGDWQVAVSDGTQFPINLKQQMGGLTTAFYGSIETQPPGGIRAVTMNKTHVRVNFTMGGAKGEVELEIGPDGRSFIGAGHMADGTPITWTGSKSASPDAAPAGQAPAGAP